MDSFMTNVSMKELMSRLKEHGLVGPSAGEQAESFVLEKHKEREIPRYLHALAGVGAFISSICFISFLNVSKLIEFSSGGSCIFWGLVFIASAILLAKFSGDNGSPVRNSFLMQSSFCFIATGKILFVTGFCALFFKHHELWGVTLGTLFISAAVFHLYPMSVDRFLSSLVVLVSLFGNIVTEVGRNPSGSVEVLLNFTFLAEVLLCGLLFTHSKAPRSFLPIAYALAISLCIKILFFSAHLKMGYRLDQLYSTTFITWVLSASLIGLAAYAAGSTKKLMGEAGAASCIGALILGCISAPGIILSICFMVLGYSRHERPLILLGTLLLPCFIVLFYYNLDISLLPKSGLLILSGLALLAGRLLMAIRKLDREVIA